MRPEPDNEGDTVIVGGIPTGAVEPSAPGTLFGRYVSIAEIARGGMGVVLRAYDPKLQREVAVKLLRSGSMAAETSARLVREARAMARLNHPNVVAIYDVGVEGESVGLVMEYVEGATVLAWLRAEKPDAEQVVARFIEAGRGLVAAHDVGLLHRDFKPANLLIGRDGRVRVTDFGLARAGLGAEPESRSSRDSTSSDDGLSIELTVAGVVLGTPPYMAPEQHVSTELTPATDQYAFCVSLWEGLVGERPFRGSIAAMRERKAAGPPPWPEAIVVPRGLPEAIRRGLAADPLERWPNMRALLSALEAAIRKPSGRRWIVPAAAILTLGVAAAAIVRSHDDPERCTGATERLGDAWNESRAQQVREALLATGADYAPLAWARLRPALDDYAASWLRMHTATCEATTVRGEQSSAVMDLKMACLDHARTELHAATELMAHADADVAAKVHEIAAELPPLRRCDDVEALLADVPAPDESIRDDVEALRGGLASLRAEMNAGKHNRALAEMPGQIAEIERLAYAPLQIEGLLVLARAQLVAGQLAPVEVSAKAALALALEWGQWGQARAALELLMQGTIHSRRDYAAGFAYADTSAGLLRRPDVSALERADLRETLASLLEGAGRLPEAEAEARAALALREEELSPDDPRIATSRTTLASILMERGEFARAEAEQRLATQSLVPVLGPSHPLTTSARNALAAALANQGKFAEAEVEVRATLEAWTHALGPEHPRVAGAHHNLAILLVRLDRLDDAETESRRAIAAASAAYGAEHASLADMRFGLAEVLMAQGRATEAETEAEAALALRRKVLGTMHPDVSYALAQVAGIQRAAGRDAEAERSWIEALAIAEAALGADHPDVDEQRAELASLQLARGAAARAIATASPAHALTSDAEVDADRRARLSFVLARALVSLGEPRERGRAIVLATWTRDHYRRLGDPTAEEVAAWLEVQGTAR